MEWCTEFWSSEFWVGDQTLRLVIKVPKNLGEQNSGTLLERTNYNEQSIVYYTIIPSHLANTGASAQVLITLKNSKASNFNKIFKCGKLCNSLNFVSEFGTKLIVNLTNKLKNIKIKTPFKFKK